MQTLSTLAGAALLEALTDGVHAVAVFSADDTLQFANPTFIELFAIEHLPRPISFSDVMRHSFDSKAGLVIGADNFDAWLAAVQSRRRGNARRSFESDFSSGRWVWVNETLGQDGTVCFIGTDITALKLHEHALRTDRDRALSDARTDALTGLHNRRHMLGCLEAFLQQPVLPDAPASLCMIDLDHFKSINDRYGHLVGDMVLRHFSALAGSQLRPQDVLGRIGGEEFLLFLPNTSPRGAVQVVERLRQRLANDLPVHDSCTLSYTFSAGVTAVSATETAATLMQRADEALYIAKKEGRDRCQMCHQCR